MTPRVLFRTFATAEAFTWAGLITALILRTTGVTPALVSIAGGLHGFVFLTYCVVTVFTWINQRWTAGLGLLSLALAVVPFATVPLEIAIDRRRKLAGPWRLRPGGETPVGLAERAQAWVLRRPLAAILISVALVVIVFLVLLWLGPPIPKS